MTDQVLIDLANKLEGARQSFGVRGPGDSKDPQPDPTAQALARQCERTRKLRELVDELFGLKTP